MDSRDLAKMIDKKHGNLLRDIQVYVKHLTEIKDDVSKFFIESQYRVERGKRPYPYFLVTKEGCEFIANKLIGTKGSQFTSSYVSKFNQMEQIIAQPIFVIRQTYIEALEAHLIGAKKLAEVEAQNQVMLPIVNFFNQFLDADGTTTMTNVGKHFLGGITPRKVAMLLQEKGVMVSRYLDQHVLTYAIKTCHRSQEAL